MPRLTVAVAIAAVTSLLLSGCFELYPARQEEDEDFGVVDVYDVLIDGTLDHGPEGFAGDAWDTFTRVTTMDFAANYVLQYRVGNAPKSDTLAYVYQDWNNPRLWILALNLATSHDHEQLVATFIHEYAHMLTLEVGQVDAGDENCSIEVLDAGCASEDSMVRAFNDQFWAAYGDTAPAVSNTDSDVAWDFYLEHEDDFVSDYAATNVVEDIAETFSSFVLEDEPEGDTVLAQKLRFFTNYPAMVEIRDRIRTEFADDLGLAV